MQVTYQLTPEDLYQGCLAWRNHRKWRQWVRWIAYFVVGLASLASMVSLFFDRTSDTASTAWVGLIFGVFWFAYMLAAPRFFSRRQFRNHPMAQSPISLGVSETDLQFHNAHADSKVAWSAYVGWGESKCVFVILPQPKIYITIPKRAFTDEQQSEFREMLRRNVLTPKQRPW